MAEYRNPGDIEVRCMKFVSSAGQIIDIDPLVVEISIFQDMLSHYLRCELVINDSVGLINSLLGDKENGVVGGFTGGEALIVSYRSADSELPFKNHFFGMYSLLNRVRVEEKSETYMMAGISYEAYQAKGRYISRAYGGKKGNQISNMIKSVVDEYVHNDNVKRIYNQYRSATNFLITKDTSYGSTNGRHRFVIPNLSVDDAINFLSAEADCDGHVPFYIFYEDSEGFKFRDVNALLMGEVKETYTYIPQNLPEDKKSDKRIPEYRRITSFSVDRQTDIMNAVGSGLYKAKTINVDMLTKKKTDVIFDYTKEGEKFMKLQPSLIPGSSAGDGYIQLTTSQAGHEIHPVVKDENPLPKKANVFGARKRSYRRSVFNNVVEITIPGDSERNVGDLVYLEIPTASTTEDVKVDQADKYLSGKYLVTKVRHKFNESNKNTFATILQCTKDTGLL